MCYDLVSTTMFFNVLCIIAWFYFCWNVGKWCACLSYPKCVALYKACKKSLTKS